MTDMEVVGFLASFVLACLISCAIFGGGLAIILTYFKLKKLWKDFWNG